MTLKNIPNLLTGANIPITELANTSYARLRVLKTLLTLPFIGIVPIWPEDITDERDAEVALQLVVSTFDGGKQFVTENTAPKPRMWHVKGYLKGIPLVEMTNWFMPSLIAQKTLIDTSMKSRIPLRFRTPDGEIVRVLIKNRKFLATADNMNTVKLDMLVQEYNQFDISKVLDTAANVANTIEKSAPVAGLSTGTKVALGGLLANYTLNMVDYINREQAENRTSRQAYFSVREARSVESYGVPPGDKTLQHFTFYCQSAIGDIDITMRYVEQSWQVEYALTPTEEGMDAVTRTCVARPNIIYAPQAEDYSLRFILDVEEFDDTNIWEAEIEVILW